MFVDDAERERFVRAICQPTKFPSAIYWIKEKQFGLFIEESRLSWQPRFVDRLQKDERPGQHSLHEQGYYYCLDFSSVFALVPLMQIVPNGGLIIDVCSAPGGKGIYAWKCLAPQKIVFNEVIAKRHGALHSNLKRCGVTDYQVTKQDVSTLVANFTDSASLVLVDAPCSGQSLRARGQDSFGCFDPRIIRMNARRQRRILANSACLVADDGFLLYTTCTYAREENEDNIVWFLDGYKDFSLVEVNCLNEYKSGYIGGPCYRMWPQDGLGAGAFSALMQKKLKS